MQRNRFDSHLGKGLHGDLEDGAATACRENKQGIHCHYDTRGHKAFSTQLLPHPSSTVTLLSLDGDVEGP